VKKYHPDQYQANPLAGLAEEKLKEINEAYDYLMNHTDNHYDTEYQERTYHDYQSNGEFDRVRTFIRSGNYEAAYSLLQTLDRNQADWYFLNGLISLNRGWYQQAFEQIQTAIRMNPGNPEYISTLNNMRQATHHYRASSRERGSGQPDLCQLCTCLYCSDCCCECFGGDIIECC